MSLTNEASSIQSFNKKVGIFDPANKISVGNKISKKRKENEYFREECQQWQPICFKVCCSGEWYLQTEQKCCVTDDEGNWIGCKKPVIGATTLRTRGPDSDLLTMGSKTYNKMKDHPNQFSISHPLPKPSVPCQATTSRKFKGPTGPTAHKVHGTYLTHSCGPRQRVQWNSTTRAPGTSRSGKPHVTLPTGTEAKGAGRGKVKDAKDHPGWFAAPSGYITLPKTNKN
ncbi:hypothetical protein JCM16303_005492 [Sporobolomyces ruberrimus]